MLLACVQLKRDAKLLTMIGLTIKHADCSITFSLQFVKSDTYIFSKQVRKFILPTFFNLLSD